MGVFHRATITPAKADLVAAWVPTQPWGPSPDATVEVVGAFRFDDPNNLVGIETHLVAADDVLYQVPLTYRNEPVAGASDAFIGDMEHSALGTRSVYDGLGDDLYVTMLAAVAMTGQGEALGMVHHEDRWIIAPANVRIQGGGWGAERVPVDGFRAESTNGSTVVFANDRFQLTFFRNPVPGPRPAIGLIATAAALTEPVILAEVS